jgi:hypothetical protein
MYATTDYRPLLQGLGYRAINRQPFGKYLAAA